ncbi:hypothetical protein J6590_054350 [Homalodisca vitripennis]|nr:hypothetical protein J6590_054350 [Homalodisca vitripennis]
MDTSLTYEARSLVIVFDNLCHKALSRLETMLGVIPGKSSEFPEPSTKLNPGSRALARGLHQFCKSGAFITLIPRGASLLTPCLLINLASMYVYNAI